MRKHMLGTITALLAIVLVAGAQTPGSEAVNAALQKVTVNRGQGVVSVEMTTKGAITPKVETLSSPDRLVVDLPNTVLATAGGHITVGSDGVKGVRMGTDAQAMTRVVVDLERPAKYELVPGPGQKLTLKIGEAPSMAQKAAEPVRVNTPASVMAQEQPAAARQEPAKAAQNFVVLDPTYAPKKDENADPTAKAASAASKFVERPEGNLLPQANGSMQAQEAPASAAPAATTVEPAVNLAAEQKAKSHPASSGPKYTGEPISVNLKDVDLKDFFRLIHEISGLNVVLDPDVRGTLTIVLDDVPWDQALDIVLKNNQLSRQLDGNVLRIASVDTLRKEAEARRAQMEAESLAVDPITVTRFLSYAHSKDVVNTLKKFLSQRGHIESDDRTNAIIINDIPSSIPPIDRLLAQLDRKTQEVEIEARVVAATRSFARDIGTQLGFGWGNNPTGIGGATSVGTSPLGVGNTPNPLYPVAAGAGGTGGVQIPLFSNLAANGPTSGLSFINATNSVRIDAVLTMAESRGLLKILSRPRVVTQNNIQAIVRQGVRIPIVTAAQLNGPPTTTYIDAFLRLTVTPQITVENTIFLNVDVENTTPDFGHQVQGNPTLITQQATTQVLVTDGGTVVIGGVIQTSNSVSISQVPLLGSIPWLGNLFKHQAVSSSNQELIFFITPRIVET
ncbi:MAG TPA: type IV pilus secretin PilQ [Terriglobales bacterium]|nr:type IV pilus secretin PilQ [Terriglobales bacterium]